MLSSVLAAAQSYQKFKIITLQLICFVNYTIGVKIQYSDISVYETLYLLLVTGTLFTSSNTVMLTPCSNKVVPAKKFNSVNSLRCPYASIKNLNGDG